MSKAQSRIKNDSYNKIIPLALILLIVPLIIFLKTVTLKGPALKFAPSTGSYPDFFSYYKAIWLSVFSIGAMITCIWYKNSKKYNLKISALFIPLGIYYLFVTLSTLLSEYRNQAIIGYQDRYEGFLITSVYLVICLLSALFVTYEKDIKVLFGALVISAFILSLLGISQFWGFDILQTDFGRHLMLSAKDYKDVGSTLDFKFPTRYIYSTLYNPNYVGSYFSMLFPISLVLFLFSSKLKYKILFGVLCGVTFINVVGCLSTTGYIGSSLAVLVMAVILRKKLLKNWVSGLSLIVCLAGLLFLMNVTTQGTIFPEFYKKTDAVQPDTSNASVNKPNNSLKDVKLTNNEASIILVDNTFNIKFNPSDSKCSFTDAKGEDLDFKIDESNQSKFTFTDPQYEGISIMINGGIFNITTQNTVFNISVTEAGVFKFLDHTGNPADIDHPETVGFKDKETFASSRGFIWSRSIPLLKDTVLFGYGPDTFAYHFPQNDFMGKIKAFNTPYIIVDKPHNMYLQIGLNSGLISLLAFLVFAAWYIIGSIKLYFNSKSDNIYVLSGVSCLIAVIGFLTSSLANDSVVSVSPVFWILLGIGIASNRLYVQKLKA